VHAGSSHSGQSVDTEFARVGKKSPVVKAFVGAQSNRLLQGGGGACLPGLLNSDDALCAKL
jgi:hypothetical protein